MYIHNYMSPYNKLIPKNVVLGISKRILYLKTNKMTTHKKFTKSRFCFSQILFLFIFNSNIALSRAFCICLDIIFFIKHKCNKFHDFAWDKLWKICNPAQEKYVCTFHICVLILWLFFDVYNE